MGTCLIKSNIAVDIMLTSYFSCTEPVVQPQVSLVVLF
jgi:hypothetical protein